MTATIPASNVSSQISAIYQAESRRVYATLVRLLGDFDLAEEMLHEAFAAAMEQWPTQGIPANARAWLVATGKFKGIDLIRRRSRFHQALESLASTIDQGTDSPEHDRIDDDRLRLIFTCCHPAIDPQVQVALTLREVCGLTTEAIASAFLVAPATMAQRIVRGKAKIREAGIPYEVPDRTEIANRSEAVLAVCYLVFNEGYSASSGDSLTRPDLSEEAIRLGRLLCELMPDIETLSLLALMLLQESRRAARVTPAGDLIVLEEQDRSLWNHSYIREARELLQRAGTTAMGPYALQANIALEHAVAPTPEETRWDRIAAWYDLLYQVAPTPVVDLNRAVAVAMRDGPLSGLAQIDQLAARGELVNYHLLHAARADLLRRAGDLASAAVAYRQALSLVKQEPERRYLARRLAEIS